ncbi:MAG TPA: hypothetical protein VJV03_03690, partial [Pyrinomonadaceae bacterium]|nr:hypothetical protein [Pyrinomonadaceae bacterium]
MKLISSLILAAGCVLILSCSTHDEPPASPPAPPSVAPSATAPAHDNVAGGLSTPEPGETE